MRIYLESRIVELRAAGWPQKLIARALGINYYTLRTMVIAWKKRGRVPYTKPKRVVKRKISPELEKKLCATETLRKMKRMTLQ